MPVAEVAASMAAAGTYGAAGLSLETEEQGEDNKKM
jgi:hypothetical protein